MGRILSRIFVGESNLVIILQISDILYYEVLDIPLPELQSLKTLKVAILRSPEEEVCPKLKFVFHCALKTL